MGKRSNGKKRGLRRGVGKHLIKSKVLLKKNGDERTVLWIGESVYFSAARKCFEFLFYCCSKLYLAPFTRSENGKYVPLDHRSKLIHRFTWSVMFLMLLHKLVGVAVILWREELKIETFLCISLFLIYFVSFCISLVMIAKPEETIDLLNSWPFILSCLKEFRNDVPSVFDDLSTALKVIAALFATQAIAITAALQSLAFSTLPTCYFPTAQDLGLIPQGSLSPFEWQLLMFPLEYMTYLPPMLSAPFSASMLLILVGVLKMVGQEIR